MERLSGAGGNWRVMDEIADLNVVKQAVEIPADVGNFVTPEEAISKLKPFECDQKQETSDDSGEPLIDQQQPEEMSQDIRQKAMALVENLPESLLDKAVKVLESWYVKANNLK